MSARDSRHSGVSCDACGKSNFPGKRYKCLICYDFDLCSDCYDGGQEGGGSGPHEVSHPMQCILTRVDAELHYAGESHTPEQSHAMSHTCPLCGQVGFSEAQLFEHVTKKYSDTGMHPECICPVCAASPVGEPNLVTDDLPSHFALEHRSTAREGEWGERHVRRLLHQARGLARRTSSRQPSLFNAPLYADIPGDIPFPPRPQSGSRPEYDDLFADLIPQLSGREGRNGEPSLPSRNLPRLTDMDDSPSFISRLERSSPGHHRALMKHFARSGGNVGHAPLPAAVLSQFLQPERDVPEVSLATERQLVRSRWSEVTPTQAKNKGDPSAGFLLSGLSISDTLSDEEEPDKETEELRRQFVQELILSTLCLSDERSDSGAT